MKIGLILPLLILILVSGCTQSQETLQLTEEDNKLLMTTEELNSFGFEFENEPDISKWNELGTIYYKSIFFNDTEQFDYILNYNPGGSKAGFDEMNSTLKSILTIHLEEPVSIGDEAIYYSATTSSGDRINDLLVRKDNYYFLIGSLTASKEKLIEIAQKIITKLQ